MNKPKILFFIASLIPTETDERIVAERFHDADVEFRYSLTAENADVETCDAVFGMVPEKYVHFANADAVVSAYRQTTKSAWVSDAVPSSSEDRTTEVSNVAK